MNKNAGDGDWRRDYCEREEDDTVTGLSGNWIQIEQLRVSVRISFTDMLLLFFFFSSSSSSSSSEWTAAAFPVMSCWRFLAFCCWVREVSASIANMAATSSASPSWWRGRGGGSDVVVVGVGVSQSGQSQRLESARLVGRELWERQGTCHGVSHVTHLSFSSSAGWDLHAIHTPSMSHGNCAIASLLACGLRETEETERIEEMRKEREISWMKAKRAGVVGG